MSNPADIALAAWQAAGIKGTYLDSCKRRWKAWQAWCDANGTDPLGATHDEFIMFEAEHNLSPTLRMQQASALFQPYRHVNKPNPAHPPPSLSYHTRDHYTPALKRYESWCKTNHITSLPAQPQDVAAFLTQLAESKSTGYLQQASCAISRLHILAGYASPTRDPAVTSTLKNIRGTPAQLVTDTESAVRRDRRRARWTNWCRAQGVEPEDATAGHFLQFLQELATTCSRATLNMYQYQIAPMYADRSIIRNPQTKALIDSTPTAAERTKDQSAIKKQADAEILLILQTEAELMKHSTSRLPFEKRQRVARAMAHADVTDKSLQHYVRYAWIPFKEWSKTNGTSPEQATPSDVSAFLCEVADEKGPTYANSSLYGLQHVFTRVRPTDNPADAASVRKTLKGLKRERPSPTKQAKPIGIHELGIIIQAAHTPKPHEFEHQTRLRAAVDIALLCTMHDAALRGEEAAEAEWDDLKDAPDANGGSVLTVRRSKTDQLHEGAVLYLTQFTTEAINHMQDVRRELGIEQTGDARIFRLGKGAIYRHIQKACKHAGLSGSYSMHSLRVGAAQDLVTQNFSDIQIMILARWKSQSTLTHYTKAIKATKNAVAQREQRRNSDGDTPKPKPADYGIRPPYSKARLGH